MRQRTIRNREKIIDAFGKFLVEDPKSLKGHWNELFGNGAPVKLELGSGKGQFITSLAEREPGVNFIACEGAYNVYPRILQKLGALEISNVRVLGEYIADPCEFFEDDELSGLYLNFSDPWKKRYYKRRLTYREKLLQYARICRPGSVLEFKTDNDELFEFSLQEIDAVGLKPDVIEYDLHNSLLAERNILTEYEEKFTEKGSKIKFLSLTFT